MNLQETLIAAGIRPHVYYRRIRKGMSHEDAMESSKSASTATKRTGNPHDWSMNGTAELLRKWKRYSQ